MLFLIQNSTTSWTQYPLLTSLIISIIYVILQIFSRLIVNNSMSSISVFDFIIFMDKVFVLDYLFVF
jgi:hypothetical protein